MIQTEPTDRLAASPVYQILPMRAENQDLAAIPISALLAQFKAPPDSICKQTRLIKGGRVSEL